MPLYLLSASVLKRSKGHSALGAATYQSGEKLIDLRDGKPHHYKFRTDVLHNEIMLPNSAPPEFSNQEALWNAVEMREDKSTRRGKAQLARLLKVALQREFTPDVRKELLLKFVADNFVKVGMCADISIHAGVHSDNPHAHILLTMRNVTIAGFELKNREWNDRYFLNQWREEWAKAQNREFMQRGMDERVAHKSHIRRGDHEHKPTLHLGPALSAMERRGVRTLKGDYNRAIVEEREDQKQREQEYQRSRGRERGR